MGVAIAERQALFGDFARAFFKEDLDALYRVVSEDFVWHTPPVTPGAPSRALRGRAQIAAYFAERHALYRSVRFEEVVYHHASEASFMSFRMVMVMRADGSERQASGVERYLFKDGKLALKDVYLKPLAVEA